MSYSSAVSDEIWSLLKETQKNLRELSASQKKAGEEMRELRASQKESAKKAEEEMRELRASQKESAKKAEEEMRELRASQKKTDQQIQKVGGRFNERWGALVESLVEGKLVELFQKQGIDIAQTHTRSTAKWKKADGSVENREFDIIVANGTEVVAVEVKTALTLKNVNYFLKTLKDFKHYFPRYKQETVYGAVAYLASESKAHLFAEEEGLFLIRATGDSASLVNQKNFKPKAFS